jgi:hypothetical protein
VSLGAILANWKYIAMGALALACAVLFGLWKSEEASYANYRVKQAAAVLKAQERADKLANELVIQQAIAMAGTEKVSSGARTELRQAPDDAARLRAISRGLYAITRSGGPQGGGGPPDAVPASRAGR